MRVTILGCGSSGGVPILGPEGWGVCDPANPKNRRRRVSILVEEAGTTLLVDTSPDLREQLIDAGVYRLDAVLYTHAHADHLHGIDDLRSVNFHLDGPLDAYAAAQTLAAIEERFGYVFAERPPEATYWSQPWLRPRPIDGPFRVGALEVTPFTQDHGFGMTTLGFRFGPVAYSTDVKRLEEAAFAALAGVEVWIVDAVREEPHPTHTHLAQTLDWIARLRPRRAVLTHMSHLLDYEDLRGRCPPGVEPGYDGMVIEA